MLGRFLVAVLLGSGMLAPAQVRAKGALKAGKIATHKQAKQVQMVEQLRRMSPEDRQKALDRLPPERRKQVENRLEMYERMRPADRERLARQVDNFQNLPQEKRAEVRRLFGRFNQMPAERQPLVRQELQSLRQMNSEDRAARMNSDEFRNRHTPAEQQWLSEISKILPPMEDN